MSTLFLLLPGRPSKVSALNLAPVIVRDRRKVRARVW